MADYVTLLGAEDVRSAANTMSRAADTMRSAASNFDSTMDRHQRFMDEWMTRFESAIDRMLVGSATPPMRIPNDGFKPIWRTHPPDNHVPNATLVIAACALAGDETVKLNEDGDYVYKAAFNVETQQWYRAGDQTPIPDVKAWLETH